MMSSRAPSFPSRTCGFTCLFFSSARKSIWGAMGDCWVSHGTGSWDRGSGQGAVEACEKVSRVVPYLLWRCFAGGGRGRNFLTALTRRLLPLLVVLLRLLFKHTHTHDQTHSNTHIHRRINARTHTPVMNIQLYSYKDVYRCRSNML